MPLRLQKRVQESHLNIRSYGTIKGRQIRHPQTYVVAEDVGILANAAFRVILTRPLPKPVGDSSPAVENWTIHLSSVESATKSFFFKYMMSVYTGRKEPVHIYISLDSRQNRIIDRVIYLIGQVIDRYNQYRIVLTSTLRYASRRHYHVGVLQFCPVRIHIHALAEVRGFQENSSHAIIIYLFFIKSTWRKKERWRPECERGYKMSLFNKSS